jgi:CHAD domain-containing protein
MKLDSPTKMLTTGAPAGDRHETEWQFDATDLDAVCAWLLAGGTETGLRIEPQPVIHLRDTYFDTDRWSIFRAGFALRVREGEAWPEATLKSLEKSTGALVVRREIVQFLADADLHETLGDPGPVTERVCALAGRRGLRALFTVETQRKRFALTEAGSKAEIALDSAIFRAENGAQRELRRVEIELVAGSVAALTPWVRELQAACALAPSRTSKFWLGLECAGIEPRKLADLGPTVPDSSMGAARFALTVVRRGVLAMLSQEPATRLGEDPEALHDLRVTVRRLETYLGEFRAHLPAAVVECREPLRDMRRTLGRARDVEVQLAELDVFAEELSKAERPSLEPLRQHLELVRREARAVMLEKLDADDTQDLLWRLETAVTESAPGSPVAHDRSVTHEMSATQLLATLVQEAFRKVRKRAARLSLDSPSEEFHAARARVKRLLHLVESARPLFNGSVKEYWRALQRLQDLLGTLHDSHVASERLRVLAAAPRLSLPGGTLFLMGRLNERHERTCGRMRRGFPKAWRRVRGKRWKALRRELTR